MSKIPKIFILLILIFTPIIFYKAFIHGSRKPVRTLPLKRTYPLVNKTKVFKPKVALIFDDLGENFKEFREIYALNVPLTISIIPGLKFSNNIANMGSRSGLSVLIHLPMEPKREELFRNKKFTFLSNDLPSRELEYLLRFYLNSIRVAIGVNNHMGSQATEDPILMRKILKAIKAKKMVFIDSRTSLNSVACQIALEENLTCDSNEGFVDSINDLEKIGQRLDELIGRSKGKEKIIIILHPHKNTFAVLKAKLPKLKQEVDFITIKEYFNL